MDNDFYSVYTQPVQVKKKRGVLPVICVVLSVFLFVSLAATGVVTYMYVNNNTTYSSDAIREEVSSELDAKYYSEIQSLKEALNNTSASTTNLVSTVTSLNELTSPVVAIAENVRPAIVEVKVTVPSAQIPSGFFWYQTGSIEASGSGIILSSDGYIVTNYHVVSYYDNYSNVIITVVLSDGTELDATFVGGDEENDLAVLKVDPAGKTLTAATLGSSEDLKVGELVVAIGNPLGSEFAGTVTMGIVSGLDRNISDENTAETLIQTDAAINPGNSGGALVNSRGEVIGITSSKIADTDVEGLGFAIPIDYAKPIIEDLIAYGYVKDRPATGISGETVTSSISRYYGVPTGVLVTAVEDNSGAELAGIEVNDIITEIDGQTISSMSDIQSINEAHSVGDIIKVTYYRNKKYYTANVKLLEDRGR